jgi:hypothetical protein
VAGERETVPDDDAVACGEPRQHSFEDAGCGVREQPLPCLLPRQAVSERVFRVMLSDGRHQRPFEER